MTDSFLIATRDVAENVYSSQLQVFTTSALLLIAFKISRFGVSHDFFQRTKANAKWLIGINPRTIPKSGPVSGIRKSINQLSRPER